MPSAPKRRNYDRRLALIERIAKLPEKLTPFKTRAQFKQYIRAYYRNVSVDDVNASKVGDLAAAALAHARLAKKLPRNEHRLRVYNPTLARDGWSSPSTIVEIAHTNMPFLVDSLGMTITRLGFVISLTVHPLIRCQRTDAGMLTKVLAPDHKDGRVESFIRFEINHESRRAKLAELEQALEHTLGDVQAAVRDWPAMRERMNSAIATLQASEPKDNEALQESTQLLQWLLEDRFTFLAFREYKLRTRGGKNYLTPVNRSGLGVKAASGSKGSAREMTKEMDKFRKSRERLLITKANSRSTVHRPSYLDYVGIKTYDKSGNANGELRFLGLFTSVAYSESPTEIPLVRLKVQQVMERSGLDATGHRGKELMHILSTFPRDELFQSSVSDLSRTTNGILNLQDRRRVKFFVRRDTFRRFYSCLVYIPREKYNTEVRERAESILMSALEGSTIESNVQLSASALARVHSLIYAKQGQRPKISIRQIEAEIEAAVVTWRDRLRSTLIETNGHAEGAELFDRYSAIFPLAYEEDVSPQDACSDIAQISSLIKRQSIGLSDFRLNVDSSTGKISFRLFRIGNPIALSDTLPLLENLGMRVINERPYKLRLPKSAIWIQDFELEAPQQTSAEAVTNSAKAFAQCFALQLDGRIEADGYNRLVLVAGLDSRQIELLRTYGKFLMQLGLPFSQQYMEDILLNHPGFARAMVAYFEARFDPTNTKPPIGSNSLTDEVVKQVHAAKNLDADRLLRAFFNAAQATLRTNYFCRDERGELMPSIAVKLDTKKLNEAPLPRPQFEIFVYSPRVEGVHLRAGSVARGGLRWSDRREDFRTEVLGLMKAQTVKNTIIVPTGAKGGFYPKRLPQGDRETVMKEVISCYTIFIDSLLQVTDNLVDGKTVAPAQVVCYDPPDPYLVVAADKGTATFSDLANKIAIKRNFWLGDAFASGGSAGYDHKKMAITARGGWEAVKRHFREIGVDTQSDEFTVAGIGDMSGDVFGNGMLLSRKIRLQAAFNHQHIFIDPSPDAETSFRERHRLFKLKRSSWADYDTTLISDGGGIFERSAKTIKLSSQITQMLDLKSAEISPPALVKAILLMKVDLLWNGGIGTYVKASSESHADVGDRHNDVLRINGNELKCKVVGEGGNLGLTQLARIEFATHGGQINTDFIDNSAGVDSSDREVNIKILLRLASETKSLPTKSRNKLLAEMTDEVAALVLRNNYLQTQAISMMQVRAEERLNEHRELIRNLERSGILNRALEFLPNDEQIADRKKAGLGLTRPEISVILSYAKLHLFGRLFGKELDTGEQQERDLALYFPAPLRRRYGALIPQHRLSPEINLTLLTNSIVNRMGPVFAARAEQDTGLDIATVAQSYVIAREISGARSVWDEIEKLDNRVPTDIQYSMMYEVSRKLRHACYWLLKNDGGKIRVQKRIVNMQQPVETLLKSLPSVMTDYGRNRLTSLRSQHARMGVPDSLANKVSALRFIDETLEIVDIATQHKASVDAIAIVYFGLGKYIQLDWIRSAIDRLQVDGRWQARARGTLRDNALRAQREMTQLVHAVDGCAKGYKSIEAFLARNEANAERVNRLIDQMREENTADFATLSVAVDEIRRLIASA